MTRLEKAVVVFACSAALVTAAPGAAKAWNAGTHVYIAAELQKGGSVGEAEWLARLYGANGPDLFNYALFDPYLDAADYLHDSLGENAATRLWATAAATGDPVLVAFAYGFAAHDNAFGADSTAHDDAVTGGLRRGYVIEKSELVAALVGDSLPVPPELLGFATDLLVELAVDVLVRQELDPAIGQELAASVGADGRIADLLVAAFGDPLSGIFGGPEQAAAAILYWDDQVRTSITPWYASALAQDDPVAGVAGWVSQAAILMLGIEISVEQAQAALGAAIEVCRRDYRREVFATIGRVNAALSTRHIVPRPRR